VLLPLPSRPSKVINFPRAATSEMIAGGQGWSIKPSFEEQLQRPAPQHLCQASQVD
jgi:hypothetical protein